MKEIWILWTALADTIGLGKICQNNFKNIYIEHTKQAIRQYRKADLLFSRDENTIKRTNAQISEMEHFKWDTSQA